jgi:hypothetical protein
MLNCLREDLLSLMNRLHQVETSSFASDDSVKVMLHDMEEQFAARFCELSTNKIVLIY